MITAEQVKTLREKTNVSVMECKRALEATKGDIKKALENLKNVEKKIAEKKSDREMNFGIVEAYVHNNGKIGVLLELVCETDFVARNEEFQRLAHNLAMHIAAMNSNKDDLLIQPYIKNPDKKVEDLIAGLIGKLGENIQVRKFVRYEI